MRHGRRPGIKVGVLWYRNGFYIKLINHSHLFFFFKPSFTKRVPIILDVVVYIMC